MLSYFSGCPHQVLETGHVSAESPPEPLLPGHSGHVSHVIPGPRHGQHIRGPGGRGAQQAGPGGEYCPVVTSDVAVAVVAC